MKYIKYLSLGNTVGLDNDIESYWEIDDDGYIVRSVDVLSNGQRLKYSESHQSDTYGQLPEGVTTEENLQDPSYGLCSTLEQCEFESAWLIKTVNLN